MTRISCTSTAQALPGGVGIGGEGFQLIDGGPSDLAAHLLSVLQQAVQRQPRLAAALLRSGLHSPLATAASAAEERSDTAVAMGCQAVCAALEQAMQQELQTALERHGGWRGAGGGGSGGSGGDQASSWPPQRGANASGSHRQELRAELAAAKRVADSIHLLEEGGQLGQAEREPNFQALVQLAGHLQRVWQLEQPPEEQQAERLRLAAAAAHRSCANLRCTNLSGASEKDCPGRPCRWVGWAEERAGACSSSTGHAIV